MPSVSYALSSFSKTNTDLASGATFTASASGSAVSGAYITSATLYLSSIRTYSSAGYLTFTRGSGSGTTGNFSSNSSTHSETVTLSSYNDPIAAGILMKCGCQGAQMRTNVCAVA